MTAAAGSKYMASYDYYDGLGRLFQKVQKGITPAGSNLISLQEYDGAGRRSESWLPIVSSSVYMSPSAIKSAAPGNYSSDSRPYSKPVYSVSPLDRILKRYSPGAAWASKPVTMDYLANSSDVNCINYSVSSSGALVNNGTYAAGQLRVVKRIDEDQHVSYTFTDKQGHILLERQMQGSEQHDTYYVYNDLDNLCFVLQPMYQSVSNLDQYAFQYKYDNRNRCNWKKLPGASAVSYVYDEADNMIFSQDGKQYASKQWSFYLYDKFHRLAVQGVCSNTNTAAVSNVIVSCTRVNSNSGLGNSGYTSSFALVSPEVHRVNYYDDYAFRSLTGFDNAGFPAATIDAKGYVTGSVITVLGSSTKLYSANYYDFEGRITKTVQGNLLEGYDTTNTVYTFTGKPKTVTHTHSASGKSTRTEVYTYTYDHADRISKVQHSLGSTSITLYDATYDNFGRLLTKQYHGTSTNKLTYAYNLRSWLTGISGTRFTQNLYYNTGVGTAKYNGSISSMTWKSGNESTVRGYKFTYDGLDRMLNATYGETAGISTNANRFSENVTGYDKNGNIKGLQRYGQLSSAAYGMIDNLTLTLNGNQLNRVDDAVAASTYNGGFEFKNGANAADEYSYDANGNLTKDLNKGISGITYNFLNLPNAVTFSDGSTITYTYGADGTKLRTVHKIGSTTTTTDYCGNVIYENGVQKLLLTEEGYITLSDSKYHYYLKDHQGNNRVVISQSGTVEETSHYYPFGGTFASAGNVQPYKYNGKEYDSKKGLNWYDYGARHYDAALGRFETVDPSAENYFKTSLYAYCGNSPISRIDPTGADWYEDKQGNLRWQEGSEALKGYTNIGSSASIALGNDNYLNFYQNGGILANQAVNAFDLIASSGKLQNQFLGKTSPLSEDSKSALFNSLNSRSIDAIARPIGEAAFGFGAGEFGGMLLGKAIGWAVGKVAGRGTQNAIQSTAHGVQRIAGTTATRGGVLSVNEVRVTKSVGKAFTQADGATVYLHEITPGRFNAVVEGRKGIITTMGNWSQKSINRIAKNYGWNIK